MIPTLISFALVGTALTAYSALLLAVTSPRAYRNGHTRGWEEGRAWQQVNAPRNVIVLPKRAGDRA